MDFNIPTFKISPDVQKQLNQNAQNRQIEINSAKIQIGSTAEIVAKNLYKEILNYQRKLLETEDVAIMLVQFNQSTTIFVTEIGYSGYNLICFHGEDKDGKPLTLIQHVQQLNFLLMVVPKSEPEAPKRKIGFVGQVD